MRGSERTRRTTYGTLAKIKMKDGMRGAAEICSTVNMAAAEHVDNKGETEDGTASAEDDGHPWSYLATMFSYLRMGLNA